MLYLILKTIHVVSMAVWVGGAITLFVLQRVLTSKGDTGGAQAIGRSGKELGPRLFMPSMIITLLTGLGMMHAGQLGFGSAWIIWGIVGLVLVIIINAVFAGGAARRLAQQTAAGTIDAAGVAAVQKRMRVFGIVNIIILLSIVVAMVLKF